MLPFTWVWSSIAVPSRFRIPPPPAPPSGPSSVCWLSLTQLLRTVSVATVLEGLKSGLRLALAMPPPAELAALIASTNACWPHATLIGGAGGFPDAVATDSSAAAVITVVAAARRIAFITLPFSFGRWRRSPRQTPAAPHPRPKR